ncbi:MAG: TVP38/TMEM64 family protein [Sedimentisphaeraceae bacterium JB056]
MTDLIKRVVFFIILTAVLLLIFNSTDIDEKMTLSNIQDNASNLKQIIDQNYLISVILFITGYVMINLCMPVAGICTLLAGFLFGTIRGAIYVEIAATIGALCGFYLSRYFCGYWIQRKWGNNLSSFNKELAIYGHYFLVFIRMIPLIPYILVNFLVGLTKIKATTFIWTTAVGSLPGILIFSYAGRQLLTIRNIDDVLTPKILITICLLVFFAFSIVLGKIYIDKKITAS